MPASRYTKQTNNNKVLSIVNGKAFGHSQPALANADCDPGCDLSREM